MKNLAKLPGRSGVIHQFEMLLEGKRGSTALDIYSGVQENEILRTFLKKFDTGKPCHIISLGTVSEAALRLAAAYGIRIFTREDLTKVADFLKNLLG